MIINLFKRYHKAAEFQKFIEFQNLMNIVNSLIPSYDELKSFENSLSQKDKTVATSSGVSDCNLEQNENENEVKPIGVIAPPERKSVTDLTVLTIEAIYHLQDKKREPIDLLFLDSNRAIEQKLICANFHVLHLAIWSSIQNLNTFLNFQG